MTIALGLVAKAFAMVLSTLYWTTCIVYAVYIWRVTANMIVNFVPGRVAKYRNQYLYLRLAVCLLAYLKTTCTKRSVFCACTRDVFRSSADNTVGYTLHTSGVVDEWGVAPSSLIGWATALTLSSFTMAANSPYEKSSILCCPCNDCTMCIGLVAFTRLWCVLKVVDMPETRSVRIYISTVVLIGCVASRPVIGCHWSLSLDGCSLATPHRSYDLMALYKSAYYYYYYGVWRRPRTSGHIPAVVFQMHASENCYCYRLHYPRRSVRYIISVKLARSEATQRLWIIREN